MTVFTGNIFICDILLFLILNFCLSLTEINKDKAIPLQTWTVPKGFRRLRIPDFKTIGS
jgi:hypothetical protein